MTLGTRLHILICGRLVGRDEFGNRYYVDRRTAGRKRERRWVLYNGAPDPSRVPAAWHGWLHHIQKDLPEEGAGKPYDWVRPHRPNLTGTPEAYLPQGHPLKGGKRAAQSGDYEPWSPA